MEGNVHRADREKAAAEWQQYFNALSKLAKTAAMTPRAALPDLVSPPNGGLVLGRDVILGHFLHRSAALPARPTARRLANAAMLARCVLQLMTFRSRGRHAAEQLNAPTKRVTFESPL